MLRTVVFTISATAGEGILNAVLHPPGETQSSADAQTTGGNQSTTVVRPPSGKEPETGVHEPGENQPQVPPAGTEVSQRPHHYQ